MGENTDRVNALANFMQGLGYLELSCDDSKKIGYVSRMAEHLGISKVFDDEDFDSFDDDEDLSPDDLI